LQSYVTKDSLQALHAWFHSVRTRSWTRTLPSARWSLEQRARNMQQATSNNEGERNSNSRYCSYRPIDRMYEW